MSPDHLGTWPFNLRLIRYAPGSFVVYAVSSFLASAGQVVPGVIVLGIFNVLGGGRAAGFSVPTLIAFFVATEVARFSTSFGDAWGGTTFRLTTGALLRRNILAAILDRPGAAPLPVSPGAAVNRFRDDIDETSDFPTWFPQEVGNALGTVIAVILMARINVTITLFVFLPLVVATVISWAGWARLRTYVALEDQAADVTTGFLAETFAAVQAVKLAAAADDMVTHFTALNRARGGFAVRKQVVRQSMNSVISTAVALGIGIILLLAARAMSKHTFTVGDFALFVYYLQFSTESLTDFGNFVGDWAAQSISIVRMEGLVHPKAPASMLESHPVVPASRPPSVPIPVEPLRTFIARNLSYRYDNGDGVTNVDLCLEPGTLTVV